MRMTGHLVAAYVWISLTIAVDSIANLLHRISVRCTCGGNNALARSDRAFAKFRVLYDARWPKP